MAKYGRKKRPVVALFKGMFYFAGLTASGIVILQYFNLI